MAGDWIKMRTDLYRDPKVCVMADIVMSADGETARYVSQHCQRDMTVTRNVTRNAVVGALVSVWGVGRVRGSRVGSDLLVRGCTAAIIDDIADLPGFGSAMETVGWAVETEDGVLFPRFFEEFNVEPATDHKAQNADRQRQYRLRNSKSNAARNVTRDVTVTSQSNAREEKRREEEEKKEDSSEPVETDRPEPDDEPPPAPSPVPVPDPSPAPSSSAALAVPTPAEPPVMLFPVVGKPDKPAWALTPAKVREYAEAFPGLDVLAECRLARQWCHDNPTRRKTARGMSSFIFRWLERATNSRGRGGGGGGFVPKGAAQDRYAMDVLFNAAKGGDGGSDQGLF